MHTGSPSYVEARPKRKYMYDHVRHDYNNGTF
jgi:hypothetical protein